MNIPVPKSQRLTFARFVKFPENQSGLLAVRRVVDSVSSRGSKCSSNPLYLHGPTGTGKTHLVNALVEETIRRRPGVVVTLTSAEEWRNQFYSLTNGENENCDLPQAARKADLLIVEDVQYLAAGIVDAFGQLVSDLHARQVQMIFTSSKGPNELALPSRLRSRLVSGLVVALEPLQAPSRLKLLEDKAERGQLAVSREVLSWVAEHLTGAGRQLEGALAKLATLCRTHPRVLNVATVAAHFQDEVQANRPSMDKIATRVGGYFRVEPQQLQSGKRGHNVLLPRQVSMYLARQLTGLSLGRIGEYFGGRDHSTVLHACRKVAKAIDKDPVLSGTIRQIQAELA